jgi:hypothetical protein
VFDNGVAETFVGTVGFPPARVVAVVYDPHVWPTLLLAQTRW